MADTNAQLGEIGSSIVDKTSTEDLFGYLRELRALLLLQSNTLEICDVIADLFFHLRERAETDVELGTRVLLDYLVPQLADATPVEWQAYAQLRYSFRHWLDQYPSQTMVLLRKQLLDQLEQRLNSERIDNVCALIGYVGYRRPDIELRLEVIESEDYWDRGDTALSTLTYLGITATKQPKLLARLRERLHRRQTRRLVSALCRFSTPEALDLINEIWRNTQTLNNLSDLDAHLLLQHLAAIADSNPNNRQLQNKAWSTVIKYAKWRAKLEGALFLGGSLTTDIDSTRVIPYFFHLMEQPDDEGQIGEGRRLAQHRMEECAKPWQLRGWHNIGESSKVIDLLRGDARANTRLRVRMTTSEQIVKEQAWRTLLLLGYEELLTPEWFEQAIAKEDDRFVRANLMRHLSCHQITELPRSLVEWVTSRFDIERDSPDHSQDDEIFSRDAAAEQVTSAATIEAFHVLLNFGMTYNDNALLDNVDALVTISRYLVSQGNTNIPEILLDTFANTPAYHHKIAAGAALESLALEDSLLSDYYERLVPLIDSKEDRLELALLVSMLRCSPQGFPKALVERLVTWAQQPTDRLSTVALTTLAAENYLPLYLDMLAPGIGLATIDGKWRMSGRGSDYDFHGLVLGWLFTNAPATFDQAVVDLLGSQQWGSVDELTSHLVRTARRSPKLKIPEVIIDALVQRIYRMETHAFSEPRLFEYLAALAPNRLLREDWHGAWDDWSPQARSALAQALRGLRYGKHDRKERAIFFLLSLVLDSDYSVRRAALRGMAAVDPLMLYAACSSWIRSDDLDLKKRAAEAYAWITPGELGKQANEIHSLAISDPEPDVRRIAKQTWSDIMNAKRTRQYLRRLRKVQPDSKSIFQVWCYGNALTHIGNDTTVEALKNLSYRDKLPIHLARWFEILAEDTEKHWKSVMDKRNEPWYTWDGIVSETHGFISVGDRPGAAALRLWIKPATDPSMQTSWGGTAEPAERGQEAFAQLLSDAYQQGSFTVHVDSGGSGQAIATAVDVARELVAFQGTGPPPSLR
jgi:hypothetical protein